MLVWKKRDIKKTVSVLQYYVLLKIMMHKSTSISYRSVDYNIGL